METRSEPTFRADIWVAGDIAVIRQACRVFCLSVGLCVTVQPCDFIYTGGEEAGARVGLVNYPRFPSTPESIESLACNLAIVLIRECCQTSALVVSDRETKWLTRRDDLPAVK